MKKYHGFTLIEIMIALVIGLIVVAAAISIYISTVGSSTSTIRSSRLNHDLESTMTLMINDIRRAGYWGGGADAIATINPFTTGNANIQITKATGAPDNSCILYAYDANDNGRLTPTDQTDDIGADEYYGFKLLNNSIYIRKTGSTATAASCDGANEWEQFVDSNSVSITELTFSFVRLNDPSDSPRDLIATSSCFNQTKQYFTDNLDCATSPYLSVGGAYTGSAGANGDYIAQNRIVNIRLRGSVSSDPTVIKTLLGSVEVKNNRICKWAAGTCP